MHIEHEVGERPFQPRAFPPVDCKTSSRNLRCAFQVENAELFPDFPMRSRLKIKAAELAPFPDLDVVLLGLAYRYIDQRKIRDTGKNLRQGLVRLGCSRPKLFDSRLQCPRLFHYRG